jgi:hypothetical protein
MTVFKASPVKQPDDKMVYVLSPSSPVLEGDTLSFDILASADYAKYDEGEYNVLYTTWASSSVGTWDHFGVFTLNNVHMKLASIQGPITQLFASDNFQVACLIIGNLQLREGTREQYAAALAVALNNGARKAFKTVNLNGAQMAVANAQGQWVNQEAFVNAEVKSYFQQHCGAITFV